MHGGSGSRPCVVPRATLPRFVRVCMWVVASTECLEGMYIHVAGPTQSGVTDEKKCTRGASIFLSRSAWYCVLNSSDTQAVW